MEKEFTEIDIINWIKWNEFYPSNGASFDKVLSKRNELIPFVGSGLSAFIYGSWSQMMLSLAKDLPNNIKRDIAKLIEERKFYDAGDILRNNISDSSLGFMMNEIFDMDKIRAYRTDSSTRKNFTKEAVYYVPQLSRGRKRCYTINFDTVLEEAFLDQGIQCISAHPSEYINIAAATGNKNTVLLKLHGSINSNTINLVISKSDADLHYADNSPVVVCFEESITQYRFFFLGTGLRNDFTVEKLKEFKGHNPNRPHFAIIPIECNEEIEVRAKELDSMHIIPLFYPNNDEPGCLGHKWVPIILQWLVDNHNPNEDELKMRIESFKESKIYKSTEYNTIYNMHSDFQDRNGDFEYLQNFLDSSHRFLWWQIFGPSDSGKTRWMRELIVIAREQGWNSHIYDDNNYENFNVEIFGNNKNILIIFDDADLYNMETNKNSSNIDAKITFNNFCKAMWRLITTNRNTVKLRVLFTFTEDNRQREDANLKRIKNWWEIISDSDRPLANAFESCEFPENALELKWTKDDINVFCQNFIKKYSDKDDLERKGAIDHIINYLAAETARYCNPQP